MAELEYLDILVTPEKAIATIKACVVRLQECPEHDAALSEWYDETLAELEAISESELGSYFLNNSGFNFSYSWGDGPRQLSSANRKRVEGILNRLLAGLSSDLDSVERRETELPPELIPRNNKIFIVHGHDEAIRERVASTIRALKLEPVVLNEQANRGLTVLEKIERYGEVGFAVVMFTGDDLGGSVKEHKEEKYEERPRQNVLIELGYFWGRLGRDRVCLLNAMGDKVSSDLKGLGYTSLDGGNAWRFELVKELKAAGYSVDANAIL